MADDSTIDTIQASRNASYASSVGKRRGSANDHVTAPASLAADTTAPFLMRAKHGDEFDKVTTVSHDVSTSNATMMRAVAKLLAPVGQDSARGPTFTVLRSGEFGVEDTKLFSAEAVGGTDIVHCSKYLVPAHDVASLPQADFTLCAGETGTVIAQMTRRNDGDKLVYKVFYLPPTALSAPVASGRHSPASLGAAKPKYRHGQRGRIVGIAVIGVMRLLALRKSSAVSSEHKTDESAAADAHDGAGHGRTEGKRGSIPLIMPPDASQKKPKSKEMLAEITVTYHAATNEAHVSALVSDAALADVVPGISKHKEENTASLSGSVKYPTTTAMENATCSLSSAQGTSFSLAPELGAHQCTIKGHLSPALALAIATALLDVPSVYATPHLPSDPK